MSGKSLIQQHCCPECGTMFRTIIYDENSGFTKKDIVALENTGFYAIEKRPNAVIRCPNPECEHIIAKVYEPSANVIEEHWCRNCGETFRILVHDSNEILSKKDCDDLATKKTAPHAKGSDINCPKCKEFLCKAQ